MLQTNDSNTIRSKKADEDSIKIFLNVNYSGKLLKEWSNHASISCIKVLNEKLILNFSCTIKLQKSCFTGFEPIIWSILYVLVAVGKTERTLHKRTEIPQQEE